MFFTSKKKHAKDCERCRNKILESKVDRDLYNTWNAKHFRQWATFEEFYREVGNPPGPHYMLAGLIPGTKVRPGNTRWLERDGSLPTQQFKTTTNYDQLMKDAGINELAADAFHVYHEDPNSMVTLLHHLEQDHKALEQDDLVAWQLDLEKMAHQVAKEKKNDADEKATASGRGSSTRIAREFRNKLVPILALRLEEHHKSALSGRSGRHHAQIAEFIKKLDYLTIAHITVTTVFDALGRGSLSTTPMSTLFDEIGKRLDHEAFFGYVEQYDPKAFSSINRFILEDSVKGYSYKVKEARASTELEYYFMSIRERTTIADWCFAAFQSITLWFQEYKLFGYKGKKSQVQYYLGLSEEGLKYRDLMQAAQDDRAYEGWPMVHPPLDWELDERGKTSQRGGYLTVHPGKFSTVIRMNKGTIPSENAMAALHSMQNQPLQVNPFIYDTMKGLMAKSCQIGKFSTYERDSWDDVHQPQIDPKVWDNRWDENRNETPEYKAANKLLKDWHNARQVAERERVSPFRTMMVAARFRHVERFYLPTYFDNRLRMYYMVDTLNPQGSDYQKALLQFADGCPVTTENIKEVQSDLLITLANCFGGDTGWGEGWPKTDKLSNNERLLWANELVKDGKIEQEAKDPVSNQGFWTTADEPFEFLAALHEYYSIFKWGTSNVARIPNGRDATNSGSQIIGGVIKDEKVCFYCNVTSTWTHPSGEVLTAARPQDLYGIVAEEARIFIEQDPWLSVELEKARNRAEKRIEKMHAQGATDYVIEPSALTFNVPPNTITRKVTKKASMCTAYGASWRSQNSYISEELDKVYKHEDGSNASLCEKIIITNATIQGQDQAFPGLARMNKWFRDFAVMCLKAGLRLVRWKTANGSLIVQEYLEPLTQQVTTYAMGGSTYWKPIMTNGERSDGTCRITFAAGYSDEIKESKTETALAANWTHSQDAVIVQDTVHDWDGNYFAVHDCFYGPAGTMKAMTAKARESFHKVITSNPLKALTDACGVIKPTPRLGKANVEEVLTHPYTIS